MSKITNEVRLKIKIAFRRNILRKLPEGCKKITRLGSKIQIDTIFVQKWRFLNWIWPFLVNFESFQYRIRLKMKRFKLIACVVANGPDVGVWTFLYLVVWTHFEHFSNTRWHPRNLFPGHREEYGKISFIKMAKMRHSVSIDEVFSETTSPLSVKKR